VQRLPAGSARLDATAPGHLLPLSDNRTSPVHPAAQPDGFFYALIHKA